MIPHIVYEKELQKKKKESIWGNQSQSMKTCWGWVDHDQFHNFQNIAPATVKVVNDKLLFQ